jgi:transcription elongation factor Elf1
MLPPKPKKYKCPKCNYSKVVAPKSDALSIDDIVSLCPKCKIQMKPTNMNIIDKLINIF